MISHEEVRQLYLKHLGRLPETAEISDYHRRLHADAHDLEEALLGSREYVARATPCPTTLSADAASLPAQSWRAYAQPETLLAATGIKQFSFQEYLVTDLSPPMRVLSMLMPGELALLYDLAANRYRAKGVIVDAGPLLGLSTCAFAKGVSVNKYSRQVKAPIIYSYDLFRNEGDYMPYFRRWSGNA